jgi:hypothetical protein
MTTRKALISSAVIATIDKKNFRVTYKQDVKGAKMKTGS